MDISTKNWRLKTDYLNQCILTNQKTGAFAFIPRSKIPNVNSLAMMHSHSFDTICEQLFAESN